ncbi:hypothetical protein ACHQM5_010412 [Ranunculus cassubicifolius]
MKMCGETVTETDMLEKTLSTFSATDILLQQHNRRPVGTQPFPEVNHTGHGGSARNSGSYRGRGNNGYRGRGRNGNRGRGRGGRGYEVRKPQPGKGKNQKNYMNGPCNRCGNTGHYAKDCKSSLKTMNEYKKGNAQPETHFAFGNEPHQKFDSSDFMEDDDNMDSFEAHHISE